MFLRRAWSRRSESALKVALCLVLCWASVTDGEGQTRLQAVEQLYASAAYEEALAALDTLEVIRDEDRLESAEYRILCLLGMGEMERAEAAIETLVTRDPSYSPNPARFSPSRRQQFDAVRREVLGRIIEVSAAEARASFEARNFDAAILRFDALPQLVTVTGSEQVASTAGSTPVYDVSSTDVVPPVALKPILPPTSPDGVTPRPGLFEILIDESGRVRSASVRRSVSDQYDALVVRESAKWRFKPALRHGQPVPFRKFVEIYAVPLASLQR
jgi:TonB family protein